MVTDTQNWSEPNRCQLSFWEKLIAKETRARTKWPVFKQYLDLWSSKRRTQALKFPKMACSPTLASVTATENNGQEEPPRRWAMGHRASPIKQIRPNQYVCPAGLQDYLQSKWLLCVSHYSFFQMGKFMVTLFLPRHCNQGVEIRNR